MKLLVACVGNVWRGDDGFGCAVARELALRGLSGAIVRDFGVRALDLRYGLEDADAAIVVDVVRRDGPPGTLYVIDPSTDAVPDACETPHHGLTSTEVIRWAASRMFVRLVGCEPDSFGDEDEGRLGLSDAVERAVGPAADRVVEMAARIEREASCTSSA